MKNTGQFTCKYEGNNTGRRSRDAKPLFDNLVARIRKNPGMFFGALKQDGAYFGWEYKERRSTKLTGRIDLNLRFQLHCTNPACEKRSEFGICLAEKAILLPLDIKEQRKKA
ncbi:MAG: hypothetical protein WC506_05700 [Candidatus Micrarchaeia archaeon]